MKEQMQLRKAVFKAKENFNAIVANQSYPVRDKQIRYAEVNVIMQAIEPSLRQAKIDTVTTIQRIKGAETSSERDIVTRLIHIPSGESEIYNWCIQLRDPSKNHELGAAHTTGRRYNLTGAFGLQIIKDEKDTGEALSEDGVVIYDDEERSVERILEDIREEDIKLAAEIINELGGCKSSKECQSVWEKSERTKLSEFMRKVAHKGMKSYYKDHKDAEKNKKN
tara:strand:+ start:452 stop:1120 length:669 start_codon:yes stop_codon:yes gene_type:complete